MVETIEKQNRTDILLVEDNSEDIELALLAFKHGNLSHRIHIARDGEEAMRFLRRTGEFAAAVRPDVVLLDLNLPRMDGREVLAQIKQDPDLRRIPVVVLTTSKSDEDMLRSYDLHVNCYVTKPVDMDQFTSVVRAIDHFWFSVVTLPPAGPGSGKA
jgi:CheY-like chemotaxis protein